MIATCDIVITNKVGLHARPAAAFVELASRFASEITLTNLTRAGQPVNAKSLNAVLGSGSFQNHTIRLTAEGDDAQEAVDALAALAARNFGEQE
jgi:phosphotransferase system HPr (HPr) family protein